MTKTELSKGMQAFTGCSFITRLQLMEYMGYRSVNSVTKYLHSLPRVDKRYYIPDVAAAIAAQITYKD